MRKFRKPKWPELSPEQIRQRARVLAIDDCEFYYLTLFEKDGYAIEKWNDIDDLQKLEKGYYDIILLDIHGVGKEHSADQVCFIDEGGSHVRKAITLGCEGSALNPR